MPVNALLLPRPDISPVCPHFGNCGGCTMQNISYARQIVFKETAIRTLFSPYSTSHTKFLPFLASTDPYPRYYRNKTRFSFIRKDENILAARHSIHPDAEDFPITSCILQSDRSTDLGKWVAAFATAVGWSLFDKQTGRGWLKHVLIREGKHTNELMVCLVTNSGPFTAIQQFKEEITEAFPGLTSLWHISTKGRNNEVTTDTHVAGKPFITEIVDAYTFRISPQAFFQPNSEMVGPLYAAIRERVKEARPSVLWDLYAGAATIGIILHDSADQVISVEQNPSSLEDTLWNLTRNQISNITFVSTSVETFRGFTPPDCIVVDPPRSGLTNKAQDLIVSAHPKQVVYISCGPEACARDSAILTRQGYVLTSVQGVDMFPHTPHTEVIVTFEKT